MNPPSRSRWTRNTPSREHLVGRAVALTVRGNRVDVVGAPRSGRSHFLELMRADLVKRDWRVLSVHGNPSFRSTPLAALHMSQIPITRDSRTVTPGGVLAEVTQQLGAGSTAVLVDDWPDVDSTSRGILRAACQETGAPLVLTRGNEWSAGRPPSGSNGDVAGAAFSIKLPPARYEEFSAAVTQRAGRQVEASVVGELFALSAGAIGLGLAILDAALADRRIHEVRGQLVSVAPLFAETLAPIVESILAPLSEPLREALEVTALQGVAEMDALREAVEFAALEELEGRELIAIVPSDARMLVSVTPPIIAEYLRSSRRSLRLARLTSSIPSPGAVEDATLHGPLDLSASDMRSAHLARLVHERLRARLELARTDWECSPSPSTGAAFVEASIRTALPVHTVDDVLRETSAVVGEEVSHARWLVLRAEHRAFHHQEAGESVSALRARSPKLGEYAGIALAKAVELEHTLLGNGNVRTLPDPHDPALPVPVRVAVHETLALVHSSRGELKESRDHIAAAECLDGATGVLAGFLNGINHLLSADLDTAGQLATLGFDRGCSQLNPEAIRSFGFLRALCGVTWGRLSEVEEVVDRVMPLGDPVALPPMADRDLSVVASIAATRRGDRKTAERFFHDAARPALPDSPWPGGSVGWARAHLLAGAGQTTRAAAVMSDAGDSAWERGALVAAAFSYLGALELDPTQDRLESHRSRIGAVRAPVVAHQFEYVQALVQSNAERMLAVADTFEQSHRVPLALAAIRHAARFLSREDPVRSRELSARADVLSQTMVRHGITAGRYLSDASRLTERENQVAMLAAAERSNQEIADELVLSVRTVESHLLHAMRKLGTSRRAELRDRLQQNPVH